MEEPDIQREERTHPTIESATTHRQVRATTTGQRHTTTAASRLQQEDREGSASKDDSGKGKEGRTTPTHSHSHKVGKPFNYTPNGYGQPQAQLETARAKAGDRGIREEEGNNSQQGESRGASISYRSGRKAQTAEEHTACDSNTKQQLWVCSALLRAEGKSARPQPQQATTPAEEQQRSESNQSNNS